MIELLSTGDDGTVATVERRLPAYRSYTALEQPRLSDTDLAVHMGHCLLDFNRPSDPTQPGGPNLPSLAYAPEDGMLAATNSYRILTR